ncbi:MAG: type 1 glutamine amidotransferase [Candidatus Levyibacteriota bacterium]
MPKNHMPHATRYSLTVGWLYPELMNTYGDRGNIIVLQKRCEWRGINVKIEKISLDTPYSILNTCDLIFMGGAQDTQQEIVNKDLFEKKGKTLKEKIESGTPGLYICGAYQFLGKYYKTADGTILPGLDIFPVYTENPGEQEARLIGNIVVEASSVWRVAGSKTTSHELQATSQVVGFENHGGRTFLEDTSMAFATVEIGFGNNGKDKTEGIIYKNSIGSYLHGPILPKNPELSDWLIQKALEVKLGKEVILEALDDSLEHKAKDFVLSRK